MKNFSTLLRISLTVFASLVLIGCGQKGPLVLEELPEQKVQQPFENSTDQIPVKKDGETEAGSDTAE